jgi:hypothetical protein
MIILAVVKGTLLNLFIKRLQISFSENNTKKLDKYLHFSFFGLQVAKKNVKKENMTVRAPNSKAGDGDKHSQNEVSNPDVFHSRK